MGFPQLLSQKSSRTTFPLIASKTSESGFFKPVTFQHGYYVEGTYFSLSDLYAN